MVTEIWSPKSQDLTTLGFFLWVSTKDEALLMLLHAQRNVKIGSDEQHGIFAHELKCESRITVGFSNIYVNGNKFVTTV
jgi:hypothetical protein